MKRLALLLPLLALAGCAAPPAEQPLSERETSRAAAEAGWTDRLQKPVPPTRGRSLDSAGLLLSIPDALSSHH